MKIEKIIELLDKHNKTGASIRRLTNDKYTEHQLLNEFLEWAEGAVIEQKAFHKLTQMLYKTRNFYNEVAKRDKNEAFNANALTIQVIINRMECEFPWIKEEDFLNKEDKNDLGGSRT